MTQTLQFFSFSIVTVAKQWEKHVFQQVAPWQVKYGTKHWPIFCQHLPSKGKNAYDPSIAFFLVCSSCCKTVGKKRMFFNIRLESSSMAGEVWNETLANFS